MNRWWKLAVMIDGVLLAVSLGSMAWLNNRPDYGVSALAGVGWFALWYVLFQTALVAAVALVLSALIAHIRKRHK